MQLRRGQQEMESTPILRVISKIMEWQEGERPETDWDAIKEIESRVEQLEKEHERTPSPSARRGQHASHGIHKPAEYEEVEESIAPQRVENLHFWGHSAWQEPRAYPRADRI